MCHIDVDRPTSTEKTIALIVPSYAVDFHGKQIHAIMPRYRKVSYSELLGTCHLLAEEACDPLLTRPTDTEETTKDVTTGSPLNLSRSETSVKFLLFEAVESLAPSHADCISTQPFSIVDSDDAHLSSLQLLNDDMLTVMPDPIAQLSGHVAPAYQHCSLSVDRHHGSATKRRRKKKLHYSARRLTILKKQLKAYVRKQRMKRRCHRTTTSPSTPVAPCPPRTESAPVAHSPPIDIQSSPDLSKRKYIYKEITTSNNQTDQMNWVENARGSLCLTCTDTC